MRVALIYSYESSNWVSCQSITKNLLSAYQIGLKNFELKCFDFNNEMNNYNLLSLAHSIANFDPEQVIFLDHKPHPIKILNLLHEVIGYPKFIKIQFNIHIFGDFTLYPNEWLVFDDLMDKVKIKFICASDRQVQLVKKFVKNSENSVVKCPFPVDEKKFYIDEKLRENFRQSLGLKSSDFVFLYTGRMSLQKNVLQLIQDFHNFLKITEIQDAYLVLAGPFDDLGNPYTGIWYQENQFYLKYVELMDNLPKENQNKILYLGNLNAGNLNILYNGSDVFVSLSAHNDEDFGMAPAEAFMVGLPAILSNWAGYASFKDLSPEFNRLIPVIHDKQFIRYERADFLKALILSYNAKQDIQKERIKICEISKKYLSITSNANLLKKYFNEEVKDFDGFTELMKKLKKSYASSPPFASHLEKPIPSYTSTYHEIYESYLPEKL